RLPVDLARDADHADVVEAEAVLEPRVGCELGGDALGELHREPGHAPRVGLGLGEQPATVVLQLERTGERLGGPGAVCGPAAGDRLDAHARRSLPLAIALNIVSRRRNLKGRNYAGR